MADGVWKESNGVFSGHYVIASSLPPERLRRNDDRWNAARSCQKLIGGSNNLRYFFPDPVGHFGLSGRLGVAGGAALQAVSECPRRR